MFKEKLSTSWSSVWCSGTGAHLGFFTLLASRCMGNTGRVFAFEPMPETGRRLLAAVDKNASDNVTVYDFAFGATEGPATLYAHRSSAMWTLVAERGERQGSLSVRCRTLDEFSQSVPPPDLIKIDAEGAEIDILRGGSGLLAERRPKVLLETEEEKWPENCTACSRISILSASGPRHWLLVAQQDRTACLQGGYGHR